MKKIILIAVLAIASFANAQKGTILVQGSFGLGSSKDSNTDIGTLDENETKLNVFTFNPKVGYQFSDHMTVGIEANVSSSKNESSVTSVVFPGSTITTSTTRKDSNLAIGPFLRYSMPLSDIFSVYADLGVGFQTAKSTNESFNGLATTSVTDKGHGIYAGIVPALFINMKKGFGAHIGIGGLGFESMKYDDTLATRDSKSSQFVFTFGQTFNIGISKNF